jgi:hypothetical protein
MARTFGNTRNELNASQDVEQLRSVETPPLSRSTSTSRSGLLANWAARRSETALARLTPEAEEFTEQV